MYIGLTRETLEDRKKRHKDSFDKGSKYAFHCAIRKYGWKNIKWKIIEDNIIEWKKLTEKEQFYIKKYNTIVPYGYNMTLGGDGMFGFKHSKRSKEIMRKRKLDNPSFKGHHHSEESLEKMRKAHKGKIISQEQRDKLSKFNETYEYLLIDPEGNEYTTRSLNRFCKEYGLHAPALRRIFQNKTKQHHGWTAKILRKL
jgi:group I intron endonuclease